MPDAPSQTDKVLSSAAEHWKVVWTVIMVCLELHLPSVWSDNFSYSLQSPLTSWDSFSRRGSAAARWPRQRRRWRWRTKFCFPANPGLTKGQCIPSFLKATEASLGKIQFITTFMPFLPGSGGECLPAFLWAIQGQGIPLFGPAAPSLPLLDVSSRTVRNGLLPW